MASCSSIVFLGQSVGVGVQVGIVLLVVEVERLVHAVEAFCTRGRWGKFGRLLSPVSIPQQQL